MSADTPTSDTPCSPRTAPSVALNDYDPDGKDIGIENFDLIKKVIELLTTHSLWEPDGTYTFEDGERWADIRNDDG